VKYLYSLTLIVALSCIIITCNPEQAFSSFSGAPAGRTGASGEKTCSDVGCHNASPTQVFDAITTNIPESGYTPGKTYEVTVTAREPDGYAFGFQARASAGSLGKTDSTQLVGDSAYVTHEGSSVYVNTDSRAWTFPWTAPSQGTGDVTFNAAMLTAHFKVGHSLYTSELSVTEDLANGIAEVEHALEIFPMPFENTLRARVESPIDIIMVRILTVKGKIAMQQKVDNGLINLDTSGLPGGKYLVEFHTANGEVLVKKAIKK